MTIAFFILGSFLACCRNFLFWAQDERPSLQFLLKVVPTVLFGTAAVLWFNQSAWGSCEGLDYESCYLDWWRWLLISMFVLFAIGDLALIFERQSAFLIGLFAFLVGHIALIALLFSMTRELNFFVLGLSLPIMLLVRQVLDVKPWPIGVSVSIYVFIVWSVAASALAQQSAGLMIGAVMFATSDAILAWRKFKGPFPGADYLVWNLYWVSILILALSLPSALLA